MTRLLSRRAMDGWLSVPVAAAMLGVSPQTMRLLLDQGAIPSSRPNVHRRVRRGDVLLYLREKSGADKVILHETGPDDPLKD